MGFGKVYTIMTNEGQSHILGAQEWSFPVPIVYGPGRFAEVAARCEALGYANPLVVTDRGSRALDFIDGLLEQLAAARISSDVFCEISPNPRDDEIAAGCGAFTQGRHDCVIAIGGGSAMDGGKAICLTVNNGADLWDFEFERKSPKITGGFPGLVTIPTTSGTGAETESTAMITDTRQGMKFCVWHPELKPAFALLDPELTLGLPQNLTAWTGADAMTHAIEAYLVPDFHPLCDGMALEGLRLVSRHLERAVSTPGDLEARGGMHVGSCLAGIAFAKGLGLVHAISHMVGAEFDTQHGLTNAILLPVVLDYNLKDQEGKVVHMAQAMGIEDTSIKGFIAEVVRVLDAIGIPRSLGEIGVPEDCAARIAKKAMKDSAAGTNPRQAIERDIATLVRRAVAGER